MSLLNVRPARSRSGLAYRRSRGAVEPGPSLLLLHGIPGGAVTWTEIADGFTGRHDVILPDLLGFGESDRPTEVAALHAVAQARALLGLLDELGVSSVVVVGQDFGAPTAVTLARLAPDRVAGIGIVAGNLFSDTPVPFPLSAMTLPILGRAAEHVLAGGIAQRGLLRAAVGQPKVRLDPSAHLGDSKQRRSVRVILAGSLRDLANLYAPTQAQLPLLQIPRFVAWGERDPLLPIEQGERIAEAMGVELDRFAGAGHFLPQERPAAIARLVESLMLDTSR